MELWLPYGETEIPVRIPDDNFYRIVEPARADASKAASLIENALENPVGDQSLSRAVKPGVTAGIIVDPIIPSVPRQAALDVLVAKLSALGVEKTTIFSRRRLSNVDNVQDKTRQLDPSQNSFTEIGKTAMGTTVDLDPELLSCEVKINLGMVMPHFATGFTGGPEIVIPSSSSIRSIARNRALMLKESTSSVRTHDNPVLNDTLEACKLAAPIYSLCLLPDGWGGISSAFAGGLEQVFREAVSHFSSIHSPKIERKLDIIIVSAGSILGMDLYHAVRVVGNVLGALRKDGTVILVAECSRGVGDPVFLDFARRFRERKELLTELRYRFKLGGHVVLFLQQLMERCRIQLVSVLPELFARDTFNLRPSQTASEAVQKAIRVEGKESKILIVPKGEFTIPVMESP